MKRPERHFLYKVRAKNPIQDTVLFYSVYFCMVTVCVPDVNEDGWCGLSAMCLDVRAVAL